MVLFRESRPVFFGGGNFAVRDCTTGLGRTAVGQPRLREERKGQPEPPVSFFI